MTDGAKHDLTQLRDKQSAFLTVEIAAWLHMFGKFHEEFLKGTHDLDIRIPSDADEKLKDLLSDPWLGEVLKTLEVDGFDIDPFSIENLITQHRNRHARRGLEQVMWDTHGRASGEEKGVLSDFAPGQSGSVFATTAFGYENPSNIDLKMIEGKRFELYEFLTGLLSDLKNGSLPFDWHARRKEFLSRIKTDFRLTVADTRRPLNDVSLFDQTASSVAFFKAAVAQNFLAGWKSPLAKDPDDKYRWRLLRVGLDGEIFWGRTAGINDLISRKSLVQDVFDQIQILLEETYPLGMEIYRDENGCVFVMPDLEDLLQRKAQGDNTLEDRIRKIALDGLDGEAQITLDLSSPTRSLTIFGDMVSTPLPVPTADLERMKHWWRNSDPRREVCSVCGVRPQGPGSKAVGRQVCDVCEERRSERSKTWATENLHTTIWTDEVVDSYGRLALIVGQFDLNSWLDGSAFNSVLAFDPSNRDIQRRHQPSFYFSYPQLITEINHGLKHPADTQPSNYPLLSRLLPQFVWNEYKTIPEIYTHLVRDSDLETGQPEDWRLALAIMRQQPSAARVRRIWETTQNFWNEVLDDLPVAQSRSRLLIRGAVSGKGNAADQPGPFHAYEFKPGEMTRIGVAWDSIRKGFITAGNLDYLANGHIREGDFDTLAYFKRLLTGNITVEEPLGYGAERRVWGTLENATVEILPDSEYRPVIPILVEPATFMVLAPGSDAVRIVQSIKAKYEREMAKVRNRLPLRIGIIASQGHTPVRVLLDSGRRLLNGTRPPSSEWTVSAVKPGPEAGPSGMSISLERENHSIDWRIPLGLGENGHTADSWFPYVYLEQAVAGYPLQERERSVVCPEPAKGKAGTANLVHAADLKAGDIITYTSSTFDFEWIDSSARRFELAYGASGYRMGRPSRPYLLEELDVLEEIWGVLQDQLEVNQIYILRDLIETKRESWNPSEEDRKPGGAFWGICRAGIANAAWKNQQWDDALLDRWTIYAVNGWLTDAVELHLHILKE